MRTKLLHAVILSAALAALGFTPNVSAGYAGKQIAASGDSVIALGQPLHFTVTVKNTGSVTWQSSPTGAPGWIAMVAEFSWPTDFSSIAYYARDTVPPGATVTRSFTFDAIDLPQAPGNYSFGIGGLYPIDDYVHYVLMDDGPATINFRIASNTPKLISVPIATPSTASIGQMIQFSASAESAPGDLLSYSWDFGDGATGTGSSAVHAYAVEGTYPVSVTVSNTKGQSDSRTLTMVINAAADITTSIKMSLKLSFQKPHSDSLTITGAVPIPAGFSYSGETVSVEVSGFKTDFVLNSKGKSVAKGSASLSTSQPAYEVAKLSVKYSKTDLAAAFASVGLDATTASGTQVTIPLLVGTSQGMFQAAKLVTVKSNGKTATAK